MYGTLPDHPGVIPLAVQDIFASVKEAGSDWTGWYDSLLILVLVANGA
jgi:hypothetical protein